MVAVFVLLGIVVAGMNLVNYRAVLRESRDTLTYLAKNKGAFPDMMRPDGMQEGFPEDVNSWRADGNSIDDDDMSYEAEDNFDDDDFRPGGPQLPSGMSPETPYEARFFSVLLTDDGTVQTTDIDRIAAVSQEEAAEFAAEVMEGGKKEGFIDDYLYVKTDEEDGVRITFLDCGRKMDSFRTFLMISLIAAAVGYVLFFFVIFFYSKRITKPVAESYEKQKRFITDAGHEIKTPLAIIKADADVLEMDHENNEWIEDIQKQTERLTSLTNDLVSLARMEEGKSMETQSELALSELIEEEASAYQMLAQAEGKTLTFDIQPAVFIKGNDKSLRRLINILMDNAMKYSPENTEVRLTLKRSGKQVHLSVWNQTKETVEKEKLDLLFDRFYRLDSSRNSETGGHGIGLSMAKAIAESHGGKITASSDDGQSLRFHVLLTS